MTRRLAKDGRSRWALMKKFVIPDWDDPSMPYLVRWRLVQTPWAAIYLHKIILDDLGRPLHDHPWAFVSIIVRGWYREEFRATADAPVEGERGGRFCSDECREESAEFAARDAEHRARLFACCPSCGFDNSEHAADCPTTPARQGAA